MRKKAKRPSRRYQRQQKFWLDGLNKTESALADWCDELRTARRFTPVVRNGLALMQSLEQGDASLLFSMFPTLRDTLYAQMEADVTERHNTEALDRLSRMEEMLTNLSLPVASLSTVSALPSGGEIRSLQVPQFALPAEGDSNTLKIVAATVDGSAIAENFLRSLGSLG